MSLCLAVKCFDAYGLSNAGDTNRQKLLLTRLALTLVYPLSFFVCLISVCTPPIKMMLQCFLFMVRHGSSSEIYVSIVSGMQCDHIR